MKIIAHRGNSIQSPENTMSAFREAWALGADGVELDVHLSRDGNIVVFHDEDGRRLAGDPRRVDELDWDTLRTWRVAGEPIPLLAEVLAAAPEGSMVMIEIKSGPGMIGHLRELLGAFPRLHLSILAFSPDVAKAAFSCQVPVWLNVPARRLWTLQRILSDPSLEALEGLSVENSWMLLKGMIRHVHSRNKTVAVWTVNHSARAEQFLGWGVDVLITDHPRLILSRMEHGAKY